MKKNLTESYFMKNQNQREEKAVEVSMIFPCRTSIQKRRVIALYKKIYPKPARVVVIYQ